jgi:hypothetical protein
VSDEAHSKGEEALTAEREDRIPDLDLHEQEDVVGGALNAYIATVQGEKQGGTRG